MKLIPNPYLSSHGVKRYIFFHNKRHPANMGEDEIRSFISDLASKTSVSVSTQTVGQQRAAFSLPRSAQGRTSLTLKVLNARRSQRVCLSCSQRRKYERLSGLNH